MRVTLRFFCALIVAVVFRLLLPGLGAHSSSAAPIQGQPPAPAASASQGPPSPPAPARGAGPAQGGRGGGRATFPAQQRPPGDPVLISRGQTLYGISCRSCHGPDLRGGDLGGPNLLRSQLVLNDQDGELILPVVTGGRQNPGTPVMPAMNLPPDDIKAIATYIHSVLASARGQGAPPAGPPVTLNVLVGDAAGGRRYFEVNCRTCHSPAGDLQGIATRMPDPMQLQNLWVSGGRGGGRGGRGGGVEAAAGAPGRRDVTVTVTPSSGPKVEGRLDRIDDFLVVLTLPDGIERSFSRNGDVPAVEIHDPLETHKRLLQIYADDDIHNVTVFLATLK